MTSAEIMAAIDNLESFPISENAQRLVNYLRENEEDLKDTFADEDDE